MTQQKLHTIKSAAEIIGVQYRQLLESCNDGTIPCYRINKSRRLVNIEEVVSIMRTHAESEVCDD